MSRLLVPSIIILAVIALACTPTAANAGSFRPGDQVVISGKGWNTPFCLSASNRIFASLGDRNSNAVRAAWEDSCVERVEYESGDVGTVIVNPSYNKYSIRGAYFVQVGGQRGWVEARYLKKYIAPTPTPAPQVKINCVTIVVQEGNTLSAIAYTYGVTVGHISSLNGISNSDEIYTGQRIKICYPINKKH